MAVTTCHLLILPEALFEMATSKSQWYLNFSAREILAVYQEVIAGDPNLMTVFEAFNVLDDTDFVELQESAELHALQ